MAHLPEHNHAADDKEELYIPTEDGGMLYAEVKSIRCTMVFDSCRRGDQTQGCAWLGGDDTSNVERRRDSK